MKTYKPYLALTKRATDYLLEVVFQTTKDQNIVGVSQEEISKNGKTYWGVVIRLSSDIQLMCGPEENVISASVSIADVVAQQYKTIKCIVTSVRPIKDDLDFGGVKEEETDIDVTDGGD